MEGQEGQWVVMHGVNILGPASSARVKTQEFGSPTPNATTKVIVRGADSGMSAILTVTVHRTPGGTVDAAAPPKYLTDEELSQEE